MKGWFRGAPMANLDYRLGGRSRGVKGWFRGAPMANLDYRLGEGVMNPKCYYRDYGSSFPQLPIPSFRFLEVSDEHRNRTQIPSR